MDSELFEVLCEIQEISLEKRLAKHADLKGSNFTHKHVPFQLAYKEEFTSIKKAHQREKQIQGWSRAKKEALIAGDIEKWKALAAGRKNKNSLPQGPLLLLLLFTF